ncbi:helix-turn-helix transcriptional regulator [Enterococcus casseliflavus]|uniref:helix-turn-helix transcriptional regulator n=1 Tax=Enterococcus casseliflavus TaxID=37734 RepID=UPI0039A77874
MREWLIKTREEKGMTQDQVAKNADIERTYYNMIERGKRRPSVEVAKRIGQVLHFEWTSFFTPKCNETTLEERQKNQVQHKEGTQ